MTDEKGIHENEKIEVKIVKKVIVTDCLIEIIVRVYQHVVSVIIDRHIAVIITALQIICLVD